jgi:hypothetical protein
VEKTLLLLTLKNIDKIGNVTAKKIIDKIDFNDIDLEKLFLILNYFPRVKLQDKLVLEKAYFNAQSILDRLKNSDVNLITCFDEKYPKSFLKINDYPIILFYSGNVDLLSQKCVTIIGTRNPSKIGKNFSYDLAKKLSNDCVIVSGLAEGIDTEAHKGAIENNGKTIAILGHGLDIVFPPQNGQLIQEIEMTKLITKSKYLLGLQCPRLLWIAVNRKEDMPEVSDSQQKIFDVGTSVGVLATSLFDGIKVPEDGFIENLLKTKELLKQNKTLFEAGFAYKDLFSRADILEYTPNGWNIIEVKSSTSVKEVNLHDVSFQKYVYQKCGLKINKCYLMHINNEYVRQGDLEVINYLHKEEITEQVDEFIIGIEERIQKMRDILLDEEPESIIGEYCDEPYQCALYDDCWGFLPNNSVFCLSRGGKKSWELFRSDIHKIVDIPDDYKLTDKQQIQKDCELTGLPFVNKEAIKQFLGTLNYPIYYFDLKQ